MSRTSHYATCVAVTVFFFAATLYITSDNSTAASADGLTSTPQVMVEAKDLPSQPFGEE